MVDAAQVYREAFNRGLRPDPILSVSEWANRHYYLPAEAASEAGKYRVSRTPYLREILDCLSPSSPVRRVVVQKGSQVGFSEAGLVWIGFSIAHDPGPILTVQPTVDLAKQFSKQRVNPMIKACPAVRERVAEQKSRDSGNTILAKEFEGGYLFLAGANSAAGLASKPIKKLFLDEIDRYPRDVEGEGSPAGLARRRVATFPRHKILEVSTPTVDGDSPIEQSFAETDQRFYEVPCPHCGVYQKLRWERLRWNKDAVGKPISESLRYLCEACEIGIEEFHKTAMLDAGRWKPTTAAVDGGRTVGFHLSALYSPLGWYSWANAATEWTDARGRPELEKVFANTVLGLTFQQKADDTPEWQRLYARREEYPVGTIPARACLLTGAVDVQGDRLEVLAVAWNRRESFVVDYRQFIGPTNQPEPWNQLSQYLTREWPHECGSRLQMRMCLIDSGFRTPHVYDYVRRQSPGRVLAVKGRDDLALPIGTPKLIDFTLNGKRIRRGVRLWLVGSSMLKSDLYGRLKLERPTDQEIASVGWPDGFVHFPMLDDEFFRQITAEHFVVGKQKSGKIRAQWVKVYPKNEVLDLMVYNIAAWYAIGANMLSDDKWDQLAEQVGAHASFGPGPAQLIDQKHAEPARPARSQRRESFWER